VWLGPVAFLVHDAEEVLMFERWIRGNVGALPTPMRPLVDVTTQQFAIAALALLFGYFVASALGARALNAGRRPLLYLVVTGAFVGNGLTHLLQAGVFGGYTPGVITAALVILPYGWGAGRSLMADAVVTRRLGLALVGIGVVLQIPLTWLALKLAGRIP
jgi:hypothetical protein